MTNESSPITPSPKLVSPELEQQWLNQWRRHFTKLAPPFEHSYEKYVIAQAAQWGLDQRGAANEAELQQARDEELEACCEWISGWYGSGCGELINGLRAARRPKPPSEADLALEQLKCIDADLRKQGIINTDKIRLALERLKELEGGKLNAKTH